MPTDVVMPQMGESIAEGTIVRWIKKVGEKVDRDEPLFEISTDKVDAEIPSPAAGVLAEIRAKEGDTVPVNSVVAVIAAAGEAIAAPAAATAPTPPPASAPPPSPQADGATTPTPRPEPPSAQPAAQPAARAASTVEDVIRQRSSPVVRKIAKENNVDISHLQGTGISGRVTKNDILGYIGSSQAQAPGQPAAAQPAQAPVFKGAGDEIVPMSVMRKKIADHMIMSRRTSAHVYSVFEVNFSRVDQIRRAKKEEYERSGAKLTYMSFITKAVVDALRGAPVINSSIDGENIVYHRDINIGVAVALDWGLIVPVIKKADEKNLLGLSRAVADVANRARAKQLKPDEVQGGTFTITNPGGYGAQFGIPIINQPQVAILGVGTIEKRAVVVDDAIGIRLMGFLTLGYDHRIIDGAVADQFMSQVKRALETWDPASV